MKGARPEQVIMNRYTNSAMAEDTRQYGSRMAVVVASGMAT